MRSRLPLVLLAVAGALAGALVVALLVGGPSGGSSPTGSSAGGSSAAASPAASAPPASSTSGFHGGLLPAGIPPRDFTLTDERGRHVSLADVRGRVAILAFLSTACPKTCTLIAQQIRGALDELGSGVPTLIVSVDPSADTPARVRAFLSSVSLLGRVEFLTGPPARLAAVRRAYAIPPLSAGESAFARGVSVFLLDRRGAERVVYQLEQLTPESLSADARLLEREP